MINRAALLVRPAQPYIDWALRLDDSGLAPRPDDEVKVYLVPEYTNSREAEEVIARVFA